MERSTPIPKVKIVRTTTMNVLSLLPLLFFAPAAPVQAEDVSQCFIVHEMVKSEDLRYFVDATSKCSREYDAVYVMVSFLDAKGRHLATNWENLMVVWRRLFVTTPCIGVVTSARASTCNAVKSVD